LTGDAPDAALAGMVVLNVGAGTLAYATGTDAGTAVATFLIVGGLWGAGGYATALALGDEG